MSREADEFLAHHGIKGMHWGIRKKESSGNPRKSQYSSSKKPGKLSEQDAKKLTKKAEGQIDRLAIQAGVKEAPKPDRKGGWSKGQKIALGVGIGVVGVAALGYLGYKYNTAKGGIADPNVLKFMTEYGVRGAEFASSDIKKSAFDSMDDTDLTLSVGQTFKRVAVNPNETVGKRLYTSFTDADNDKYAGLYGAALKQRTGASKLNVNSFSFNESIRSPSKKKRVQALIDMVAENNDIIDPEFGDKVKPREMLEGLGDAMFADTSKDHDLSPEGLGLKYYNMFSRQLVQDHPLVNAYMDKIKSMGYNSMIDDNDAGQLSDTPMILLDMGSKITKRSSEVLSNQMQREARKRLVGLKNPI